MGSRSSSVPVVIGYVYFIRSKRPNRVKIGFTQYDPDQRFAGIDVGSPVPLTKHSLIRGTRDFEKELHRRFAKYRAKGEWFRFGAEIRDYLAVAARDWRELIREERAAAEAERWVDVDAKVGQMRAEYRAIERDLSTAFMLGKIGSREASLGPKGGP